MVPHDVPKDRSTLSAGNHGYSFWNDIFSSEEVLAEGGNNSYRNVERMRSLECLHLLILLL